jgi:hypothetical protein
MLWGRRAARAIVLAVVILLGLGAGRLVWRLGTWDGRPPDIADPRACRGSTVELVEATGHFGLVLPTSATEIKFASDLHPLFGEYFILLSFRTDAAGLRSFLGSRRHRHATATQGGGRSCAPGPISGLSKLTSRVDTNELDPRRTKVDLDGLAGRLPPAPSQIGPAWIGTPKAGVGGSNPPGGTLCDVSRHRKGPNPHFVGSALWFWRAGPGGRPVGW